MELPQPNTAHAHDHPTAAPSPAAANRYIHNDGGRQQAGFDGTTRDCVVRAIAIATERPYGTVYNELAEQMKTERTPRARSPRNGVPTKRPWFKRYMEGLGWKWTPLMSIGTGCKVHLTGAELPAGRIIASCSRHFVAVIDGVIHDTSDPTRDGKRCVYGYWSRP